MTDLSDLASIVQGVLTCFWPTLTMISHRVVPKIQDFWVKLGTRIYKNSGPRCELPSLSFLMLHNQVLLSSSERIS